MKRGKNEIDNLNIFHNALRLCRTYIQLNELKRLETNLSITKQLGSTVRIRRQVSQLTGSLKSGTVYPTLGHKMIH